MIIREITKNLSADWHWTLVTLLITLVTMSFLVVSELNAVSSSLVEERRLVTAGKHVVVVRTIDLSNGPAVPTQTCTDFALLNEVRAVGGLTNLGTASVASHPGHSFRLYGGTGGIRRVLDPTSSEATGDAVAEHLSHQLGVRANNKIPLRVDSALPATSDRNVSVFNPLRHELGEGMWIVPHHSPMVAECWIEFTPSAFDHSSAIVTSRFVADQNTSISRLITDDELISNPRAQFGNRALHGNHMLLGIVLGAPTALNIWFQRSRGGLYRSFGASIPKTALIIGVPAIWVTLMASAAAWVIARAWIETSGLPLGTDGWAVAARGCILAGTAAFLVNVAATVFATNGDISTQLKDRI